MKKLLIYTSVLSVILAAMPATVFAKDSHGIEGTSHIIGASASPRRLRASHPNHYLKIHVQGQPISALTVELPEAMTIKDGVKVTDETGTELKPKVTLDPEKVTLAFAQPITPDTTLSIKLKDVHRKRFITRTLMYRINVLKVGMEREVSLGVARIRTD